MNKPLVSVFMITYNHELYIAQALDSILMQQVNFKYEIVIGEDCSTDNTRAILINYAKKYPNIFHLLLHKHNLGAVNNQNEVFKNCKGKYIAMLEGDDYWTDPYKLQKQVDFMDANNGYGLVHTSFKSIKGSLLSEKAKEEDIVRDDIFFEMQKKPIVSTLTAVIRKEALDPLLVRINKENLNFIIDIWFWQQIALAGWKIKYLPDVTALYRVHDGGITKSKNNGLGVTQALLQLDVYNTFFNRKQATPVPFKYKKLIAGRFFNSWFLLVRKNISPPYRKIALQLWKRHFWLTLGVGSLIIGLFKSAIKKFSCILNGR